jgi:hypothetical protein
VETAKHAFPHGECHNADVDIENRSMQINDIVEVAKAFETTMKTAGARSIVFDYEHEVIEKLKRIILPHMNASELIKNGEHLNYLTRSTLYYLYMLYHCDIAISVVPLKQIKILEKARMKALEISGKNKDALTLIYYGESTFSKQSDAPKNGVFHSLDDLFTATNSECFSQFENSILSTRPRDYLDYNREKALVSSTNKCSIQCADQTENTISATMMLEYLPQLIESFIHSGNYSNIQKWKNELTIRLNFGFINRDIYQRSQIILTLIG